MLIQFDCYIGNYPRMRMGDDQIIPGGWLNKDDNILGKSCWIIFLPIHKTETELRVVFRKITGNNYDNTNFPRPRYTPWSSIDD